MPKAPSRYRGLPEVEGREWIPTLEVLDDPEAFLLVDPSGKSGGGEPPISVAAATLIAASSNPKHFEQFETYPHSKMLFMATGR
jgi:hypothetical protein